MDIGGDALLNAAKSGNYEIVRLLLDWGVDINSQVLYCAHVLSIFLMSIYISRDINFDNAYLLCLRTQATDGLH